MNSGMTFDQLRSAETIPPGSNFPMNMGDGTGTKKVTKEILEKEVGKGLKIGDLLELMTEHKESLVAAINELKKSGGGSVDILDSQEEIEANTLPEKVAGALAMKEMFSALNDKLTLPDGTNIYIDMKDGVLGYNTDPERGADTFHPFTKSSLPEDLCFYTSKGNGSILSFKVQGKTKLTFSLNTRYDTQSYPNMDYLTIYNGQPTQDNSSDIMSGLASIGTLTNVNGMSLIDASGYLKKCTSGYITLKPVTTAANASKCLIKNIVLE